MANLKWGYILPISCIAGLFIMASLSEPTPRAQPKQENVKKALLYASQMKRDLKDPNSLNWQVIRANVDGSKLCYEYSAKNSFNAKVYKNILIKKGIPTTDTNQYKNWCNNNHTVDITRKVLIYLD